MEEQKVEKKPEITMGAKELVEEIKGLCLDRLTATTAGGIILEDAFNKLEELTTSKKKF